MDMFKQGMKGPTRPAPTVPGIGVTRYSPVTNWDDDPFGANVFEPTPHTQKKKPPPRPPPPKLSRQPDIPAKPSHFIRKPTVLSSLLSRKSKTTTTTQNITYQQTVPDFCELDPNKMFPKCEPKIQTGALIDLSSPPSSPTFTTRSSSDGLSVDSFGSDATTSTNHHNNHNGNGSQAESGFEDDFDLFLSFRKVSKEDTLDSFAVADPFSPQPLNHKPPVFKKPVIAKDPFGSITNVSSQGQAPLLKGPTIIRAKPARPKPPENSAILKTTFGNGFPVTPMTVNTTTPIHKVNNSFGDNFDSKPFSWDEGDSSPERESSPPMPSIPPPPPPVVDDDMPDILSSLDDLPEGLRGALDVDTAEVSQFKDLAVDEEPYAIALFDYHTDHPDDLCFSTNTRIKLLKRIDNEWLYGSLRSGAQGIFPSNYVEIKVPFPNESLRSPVVIGTAVALYDFEPDQPGDLSFRTGDKISVLYKLNNEWYFGVCDGRKGQFPINYVRMS